MKVVRLHIHNFRGIGDLELDFSDDVNLLTGVNGAGKSALLDCTAILLSRFISRMRSRQAVGRRISELDIRNGANFTHNKIDVDLDGTMIAWSVAKSKQGLARHPTSELQELSKHTQAIRDTLKAGRSIQLPLVVYYPSNRTVMNIHSRKRKRNSSDRLEAFDQSLTVKPNRSGKCFDWLFTGEELGNEKTGDKSNFHAAQFDAVRRALSKLVPGFMGQSDIRSSSKASPEKFSEGLDLNQLANGEKSLIFLLGDLARRMAIVNPEMSDPLETRAVVMIDNAELHLHPSLHRRFVGLLRETFPNSQFILSTHSPQLINHVGQDHVWVLEQSRKEITARRPSQTYGQTAERILEDVMNVPARPNEIAKRLRTLFSAIAEGDLKKATKYRDSLERLIGNDPELDRASTLIHRKSILGE